MERFLRSAWKPHWDALSIGGFVNMDIFFRTMLRHFPICWWLCVYRQVLQCLIEMLANPLMVLCAWIGSSGPHWEAAWSIGSFVCVGKLVRTMMVLCVWASSSGLHQISDQSIDDFLFEHVLLVCIEMLASPLMVLFLWTGSSGSCWDVDQTDPGPGVQGPVTADHHRPSARLTGQDWGGRTHVQGQGKQDRVSSVLLITSAVLFHSVCGKFL